MKTINQGIVLPLPYLPSIDTYCDIINRTNVLFEINETYPKQTCRNRTIIFSANGLLRLSIPVIKPLGNHTPTFEVLIDDRTNWAHVHWMSLVSAYNKSPFFLYYKDELEPLFDKPRGLLIDFNLKLFQVVNKFLKINPAYELTNSYVKAYEGIDDKRQCTNELTLSQRHFQPYYQVFSDKMDFQPNLSILDLIFNEGPAASMYLKAHAATNC